MEPVINNSESDSETNYRLPKMAILLILLLMPIAYLLTITPDPTELTTITEPAKTDILSLESAVNTDPSFDNLINLSMAYINNHIPDKSIPFLQKAIQLNPNSAIAYNNLGVAYIMTQQYQEGIDACTKALTIDKNFQLAKNNLKWGMDEKAKLELAAKTEQLKPGEKKDVPYYINTGMTYFKANNYDKAIELWNKVFDLDAKNTTALNNIGTAFMMKHQIDDAIALFQRAIELDSKNQLAKNNLAWAMDEKAKAESGKK